MSAMVSVSTRDSSVVTMSKDVAGKIRLISRLLECIGSYDDSTPIPVKNVDAAILKKIVEWCEYRLQTEKPKKQTSTGEDDFDEACDRFVSTVVLSEEDEQFFADNTEQLIDILAASNFLDVPDLMNSISQKIADQLKGKPIEEMRAILMIENDFSAKELEDVSKDTKWCSL